MTRRFKILVVEDDALIAMEMAERLGEMGYDVIGPAHSIEAAERELAKGKPDAALLDANLAGVPVLPLAEMLAADGVPLAFCTGYDRIKGVPPHLADAPVLTKPIGDADLRAALEKLTAGR